MIDDDVMMIFLTHFLFIIILLYKYIEKKATHHIETRGMMIMVVVGFHRIIECTKPARGVFFLSRPPIIFLYI